MKHYISLLEWSKKNGIKKMDAYNLARNKRFGPLAREEKIIIKCWFVREDVKVEKKTINGIKRWVITSE